MTAVRRIESYSNPMAHSNTRHLRGSVSDFSVSERSSTESSLSMEIMLYMVSLTVVTRTEAEDFQCHLHGPRSRPPVAGTDYLHHGKDKACGHRLQKGKRKGHENSEEPQNSIW